jgi:hypothetical protein
MKFLTIISLVIFALSSHLAFAQSTIYRCGNEYTNDATDAKARGCKVLIGGNVTVIQTAKKSNNSNSNSNNSTVISPKSNNNSSNTPRVDDSDQRARDSDAKLILESELRKTEQKLDQLKKEYNNGEPEKMTSEVKNNQKYLDRIVDMRAQMLRTENDIAGIKRELNRFK